MMTIDVLSWNDFYYSVVKPGGGAVHFSSSPRLALVLDRRDSTCTFYMETKSQATAASLPSGLKNLKFKPATYEKKPSVSVTLTDYQLLLPFYSLVSDLVHEISNNVEDSLNILSSVFRKWNEKTKLLALQMDKSQKIGLWAELFALAMILRSRNSNAVQCWDGPYRNVHDFRFEGTEIEVKATMGEKRRHVIHGLTQLEASPDAKLFLFSFTLTESEDGKALEDLATDIRSIIGNDHKNLEVFQEKLHVAGFTQLSSSEKTRKLKLRALPSLIPIDKSFPALTPASLKDFNESRPLSRIENVSYTIDVTGLGSSDQNAISLELSKGIFQ